MSTPIAEEEPKQAPASDPPGGTAEPPHIAVASIEDATAYLRMLWPTGVPEGGWLTISDKARGFAATQFDKLEDAAAFACEAPDRYLTMSAMRRKKSGRGKDSDAVAVPGFWFDADSQIGTHSKTALPKTNEEAIEAILKGVPLQPSLILESGGGIYLDWLLNEPWILHSSEERKRALEVSRALQQTVIAIGEAHGWEFDNTSDLPRILRAVGTLNGKYDPPRLVTLKWPPAGDTPKRYTRDEFGVFVPKRTKKTKTKATEAPKPDAGDKSRQTKIAKYAAQLLSEIDKTVEDDGQVTAIVLQTCPCCGGEQSDGAPVHGSAHVTAQRLQLKCKRESCEASGEGLMFETWTARFLESGVRAELAAAVSGLRAMEGGLYTDAKNADRYLREHGRNVRYCPESGGLHAFNGHYWEPDRGEGLAMRWAKVTARHIVASAEEMTKEIARVESEAGLRAMVNVAKLDIVVRHTDLDADPLLLNCLNGTVDLRNGKLRPHKYRDLITKIANVRYDESARDPDVDAFLQHVSGGSADYLGFLGRTEGYLASGSTREGVAFFLHGPSSTGKTTFIEQTSSVLGDGYSNVIPFSALLRSDRDGESPRPFLASARGARVVTAAEVNEGAQLDPAVLKGITGGDLIPVRDLHGRPFRMRATFKLLLAVNHMPKIEPRDDAVRRRVLVLPFRTPIAPGSVDLDFQRRLQESPKARAAWFAFMVRGGVEWCQHGLGSCEIVEVATKSYWDGQGAADNEATLLACALHATHELADGVFEPTDQIRKAVESALVGRVEKMPGDRRLASALRDFGCTQHRTPSERGWMGLRRRMTL